MTAFEALEVLDSLRELNLPSIVLRVLLALAIGGIMGIERGKKNRPAGFRTHILVCLGSALVMMTNQYGYQIFATSDPMRMGAQVVSGIGFLGAGSIIVTGRHQIKGITTAAGLWTAACCGLAVGIGFYEGAVIGGVSIYFVMTYLNKLDATIRKYSKVIELYVEFGPDYPFSTFLSYARERQIEVTDIQINKNKYNKDVELSVIMTARSLIKRTHEEMIDIISRKDGVLYVEEL